MKKLLSATLWQEALSLSLPAKWQMRVCKQLCSTSRLDLSLVCNISTPYLKDNLRPQFNAKKTITLMLHALTSVFYKRLWTRISKSRNVSGNMWLLVWSSWSNVTSSKFSVDTPCKRSFRSLINATMWPWPRLTHPKCSLTVVFFSTVSSTSSSTRTPSSGFHHALTDLTHLTQRNYALSSLRSLSSVWTLILCWPMPRSSSRRLVRKDLCTCTMRHTLRKSRPVNKWKSTLVLLVAAWVSTSLPLLHHTTSTGSLVQTRRTACSTTVRAWRRLSKIFMLMTSLRTQECSHRSSRLEALRWATREPASTTLWTIESKLLAMSQRKIRHSQRITPPISGRSLRLMTTR